MRTILLASAGAIALTVFAFSANAQTQCWWTGYGYSCAAPPVSYYEPTPSYYRPTPYAAWNAYDYRDYRYQPEWLPSYPGPKPSSGTFGRY